MLAQSVSEMECFALVLCVVSGCQGQRFVGALFFLLIHTLLQALNPELHVDLTGIHVAFFCCVYTPISFSFRHTDRYQYASSLLVYYFTRQLHDHTKALSS